MPKPVSVSWTEFLAANKGAAARYHLPIVKHEQFHEGQRVSVAVYRDELIIRPKSGEGSDLLNGVVLMHNRLTGEVVVAEKGIVTFNLEDYAMVPDLIWAYDVLKDQEE